MKSEFWNKPYKKQPFSDRQIFDFYAKYPDPLDRSPEMTQEERDNMKNQFDNATSGQYMTGQYTLYSIQREYRIHKAFPGVFIVTVFERSNRKDTSKPFEKYFLFPVQ